jgi:hypothetical protein
VTSADDIKGLPSATFTEGTDKDADDESVPSSPSSTSVGPESEVRGGPEAPSDDDLLDLYRGKRLSRK